MNKMKYESPNFDFQEMKLMERVADKCWGNGFAFVDANENGQIELPQEQYTFQFTGCEGNKEADLQARYNELIRRFPQLAVPDENGQPKVTMANVRTNVKGSHYINPGQS